MERRKSHVPIGRPRKGTAKERAKEKKELTPYGKSLLKKKTATKKTDAKKTTAAVKKAASNDRKNALRGAEAGFTWKEMVQFASKLPLYAGSLGSRPCVIFSAESEGPDNSRWSTEEGYVHRTAPSKIHDDPALVGVYWKENGKLQIISKSGSRKYERIDYDVKTRAGMEKVLIRASKLAQARAKALEKKARAATASSVKEGTAKATVKGSSGKYTLGDWFKTLPYYDSFKKHSGNVSTLNFETPDGVLTTVTMKGLPNLKKIEVSYQTYVYPTPYDPSKTNMVKAGGRVVRISPTSESITEAVKKASDDVAEAYKRRKAQAAYAKQAPAAKKEAASKTAEPPQSKRSDVSIDKLTRMAVTLSGFKAVRHHADGSYEVRFEKDGISTPVWVKFRKEAGSSPACWMLNYEVAIRDAKGARQVYDEYAGRQHTPGIKAVLERASLMTRNAAQAEKRYKRGRRSNGKIRRRDRVVQRDSREKEVARPDREAEEGHRQGARQAEEGAHALRQESGQEEDHDKECLGEEDGYQEGGAVEGVREEDQRGLHPQEAEEAVGGQGEEEGRGQEDGSSVPGGGPR